MGGSFAATKVLISLVNPVGTRRVEYVQVNRVHHGLCLVRHVWRDGQDLACIHYYLFAINPELECALKDVCDLLVVMTV